MRLVFCVFCVNDWYRCRRRRRCIYRCACRRVCFNIALEPHAFRISECDASHIEESHETLQQRFPPWLGQRRSGEAMRGAHAHQPVKIGWLQALLPHPFQRRADFGILLLRVLEYMRGFLQSTLTASHCGEKARQTGRTF